MHTIRLRGRWEIEPLEGGQVCCTRRFHRPTGLDVNSRVWLVIGDAVGQAEVTLNGRLLGRIEGHQATPARFDITADLQPGNVLAISLASPQPLDSVRLVIDEGHGERGVSAP
jgi:hypothetical protein